MTVGFYFTVAVSDHMRPTCMVIGILGEMEVSRTVGDG